MGRLIKDVKVTLLITGFTLMTFYCSVCTRQVVMYFGATSVMEKQNVWLPEIMNCGNGMDNGYRIGH